MSRSRKLSKTTSHKRRTYGYVASTHRFYVKTRDGWKSTPRSKVPEVVVLRVAPKLVIVKKVSDKKHTYGISKSGKTYAYNKKTKTWRKRKPPQRILDRLKNRTRSKSRKSKGRQVKSRARKSKGRQVKSKARKSKGRQVKSKARKSKGRQVKSKARKSRARKSKGRKSGRHQRRTRTPSITSTPTSRRKAQSRWKKVSDSLKRLTRVLRNPSPKMPPRDVDDEIIDIDLDA